MQHRYEELKQQARTDPNILGFFVTGSRGKGRATEQSDYDIQLVVKDEMVDAYREKYESSGATSDDVVVKGLTEFRAYAAWGSDTAWDRYDFAHVHVEIDKLDSEIQRLVDEKGVIPPDKKDETARYYFDAYANAVFRSLKCVRDGDAFGTRTEAAESVSSFLHLIFAVHGRLKPYGKYLVWELEQFPLEKLPWDAEEIQTDLLTVLTKADVATQQKLLKGIVDLARAEGYAEAVDGWGDVLDWMLAFQTESRNY